MATDVDCSRAVCRVCGAQQVLDGRQLSPTHALARFSRVHDHVAAFRIDVVVGAVDGDDIPRQRAS